MLDLLVDSIADLHPHQLHEREGDPNSNGRKQAALERSPKGIRVLSSIVKADSNRSVYSLPGLRRLQGSLFSLRFGAER